MMVEARVSRVELRVGNGTQNIVPLVQRSVERADVKNRRGIESPEVMVFGLVGGGECLKSAASVMTLEEPGRGRKPEDERHGVRTLQRPRKNVERKG